MRRGQRVRDSPPVCPHTWACLSPQGPCAPKRPRLPTSLLGKGKPRTKSDEGRTLGCAGRELSVKVEGVIGLRHGRLEGWLDLTPVQLLQGGVGALVTLAPPQPISSPMQEEELMAWTEHRLCRQGITARPREAGPCPQGHAVTSASHRRLESAEAPSHHSRSPAWGPRVDRLTHIPVNGGVEDMPLDFLCPIRAGACKSPDEGPAPGPSDPRQPPCPPSGRASLGSGTRGWAHTTPSPAITPRPTDHSAFSTFWSLLMIGLPCTDGRRRVQRREARQLVKGQSQDRSNLS